jgi:hypothetical protein
MMNESVLRPIETMAGNDPRDLPRSKFSSWINRSLAAAGVCGLVCGSLLAQSPAKDSQIELDQNNPQANNTQATGNASQDNRLPVRIEWDETSAEDSATGARVFVGDELFTEYRTDLGTKPILWPVLGPSSAIMTRAWPMAAERSDPSAPNDPNTTSTSRWMTANEASDHIHHRSFWFTHGEVNEFDFWTEENTQAKIVHRMFGFENFKGIPDETNRLPTNFLISTNEWMGDPETRVLSDRRLLQFSASPTDRWIDVWVLLTATDGDVHFGDTKEGSFGMRIAGSMKIDANQGGRATAENGKTDGDAWGSVANWVDYSGPTVIAAAGTTDASNQSGSEATAIDPDASEPMPTVGITIFCHPSSFGSPSRWHVREYGLFAHNPFGVSHFKGLDPKSDQADPDGGLTLPAGESIQLGYRVWLHSGGYDADRTKQQWTAFAESDAPDLTSGDLQNWLRK